MEEKEKGEGKDVGKTEQNERENESYKKYRFAIYYTPPGNTV